MRQTYIVNKIRNTLFIHDIRMPAHGKWYQLILIQKILHAQERAKAVIRKNMFRPPLCRRKFNIMESGCRNSPDCLFNRIPMITVGVYRNNTILHCFFPPVQM